MAARPRTTPPDCPACGRRPLRNAIQVVELYRPAGARWPRVGRAVVLGCHSCLRRALWQGVGDLARAWSGVMALLALPFVLLHALRAAWWSLVLPLAGPTVWLRDALADAGIGWREFLHGAPVAKRRPPLDPAQRRELGLALVVLLREVAAADARTDAREWAALRSYLRFFWADEPDVFAAADPGPEPRGAPAAADLEWAVAVVRGRFGAADERLLLQMLLGVAEQSDGVIDVERERIRRVAVSCGIAAERVDELLGPPAPARPDATDDPWEVLGLPRSASPAELRARYLALVREHHPDRHAHLGPSFEAAANRSMARINQAYRRLNRKPRPAAG